MGSGQCTDATCPVDEGYFSYEPSQAGNGILLGCFAILMPLTTFFGIRYRSPMFSAFIMTGLVFEVLCYIGRLLLHGNPRETNYFVIYLLGSSLGPTFISAAAFYILPKVMTIYDRELVDIRPKHFNFLFLAIVLLAVTLQTVGSVFASVGDNTVEIDQGLRIIIAGFVVHLGSLALFFAVYFWFLQKKHRRAGRLNPENAYVYESYRFRLFVFGWQLASWFITIRTIYRLIETIMGLGSSIAQTEAAFMVLDGAQVVVATAILTVLHPGKAFGKTWTGKNHQQQSASDFDGIYDSSNRRSHGSRRSYSPRRAPAPAQLPLAYSNKYPLNQGYSPTQTSPPHTGGTAGGRTTPGFSPRYQDSPKYPPKYSPKFSPTSTSGAPTTTKHTHRFSLRSARSGGASSSAAEPPRRSPKVQTQSNLVSSDDLW
ncbi:hypothetical protein MKZ38_002934 [Zalerion maritima]|uniref:RTA1-domain-containing protein n=1 Tax=Zalerion maritima TaxID=339359 RepID=A0AAD5RPC0_9PEZI|nr:hypothetical protein MKZ38_002934 [Zalerion maritima]